jgi:hypothetical protein
LNAVEIRNEKKTYKICELIIRGKTKHLYYYDKIGSYVMIINLI